VKREEAVTSSGRREEKFVVLSREGEKKKEAKIPPTQRKKSLSYPRLREGRKKGVIAEKKQGKEGERGFHVEGGGELLKNKKGEGKPSCHFADGGERGKKRKLVGGNLQEKRGGKEGKLGVLSLVHEGREGDPFR